MTLGEKIRSLREARDWSREKLAVEADVSYSTIVRTELGREPRYGHLKRIAKAFGVTLDELDGDTGAYLAHAS